MTQEFTLKPRNNTPDLWRDVLPAAAATDNKYTRGHALIAGGTVMTGAARLAARAAQRMGAGLVTIAAPAAAVPIYAESLESVIVRQVDTLFEWQGLVANPKVDVILIGPGLGISDHAVVMIKAALESHKPIVLDADFFTNYANKIDEISHLLGESCVFTPHEGEFSRFFPELDEKSLDRVAKTRLAAEKTRGIVLLKGAETVISAPDGEVILNHNAPPWLATAGAGDVLAGMILGLISQKMPTFGAASAAAWIHGEAGNICGRGLIAEDLVAAIPSIWKEILS